MAWNMEEKSYEEYIRAVNGLFESDKSGYVQLTNVNVHTSTLNSLFMSCEEFGESVYIPISQLRVDADMNLWASNFIYHRNKVQ